MDSFTPIDELLSNVDFVIPDLVTDDVAMTDFENWLDSYAMDCNEPETNYEPATTYEPAWGIQPVCTISNDQHVDILQMLVNDIFRDLPQEEGMYQTGGGQDTGMHCYSCYVYLQCLTSFLPFYLRAIAKVRACQV